jgi:hypothetical protein
MLSKISILTNTLLPMFACWRLCFAVYYSYLLQSKLYAAKDQLQRQGLLYLLAPDKTLLQRIARIIMILLIVANFLLCTWSISRIISSWAAYSTLWIETTAVLFHFIMAVIAQFVYMIYKQSDLSFLNRIKI